MSRYFTEVETLGSKTWRENAQTLFTHIRMSNIRKMAWQMLCTGSFQILSTLLSTYFFVGERSEC